METTKYVMGLDIGTTSAKAVLFTTSGSVVSESEHSYPLFTPQLGWAEQDPVQIEQAALRAMRESLEKSHIDKRQLVAVGLSSAMHALICVDHDHRPLSPSIIWADGRSSKQATSLREIGGQDLYLRTGTPIHPMSPLVKLVWMKENHYQPYEQAAKFISIKEFLIYAWFGSYVVDYSVASATGMFNIHTLKWDEHALKLAGVKEEQLGAVVAPTYQLQGLRKPVADQIGISTSVPFIIGGSDGPLANIGIGAIDKGETAITIGTSGAIRQMTNKPNTDESQQIFCYAVDHDLWVMGGATNNGGNVLYWLKDILGAPYEKLLDLAERSTPGAGGLLFLPYLNGERAPLWDADARGSYFGLAAGHTREDMIRASLEGVIFNIYQIAEALTRLADQPKQLYASGGFARSSLWVQILADIFGTPVLIPNSHQSSAWGAAWIALYSIGEVGSIGEIKASIPMKTTFYPNASDHKHYQQLYEIFKQIYGQTMSQLNQLKYVQSAR